MPYVVFYKDIDGTNESVESVISGVKSAYSGITMPTGVRYEEFADIPALQTEFAKATVDASNWELKFVRKHNA